MGEQITFAALNDEGQIPGYLATPDGPIRAAIVVVPEIFGVNPGIRHKCKVWADHFVGPEAQAAIHAGLDPHPQVTLHDYVGLDHGFAAEMGSRRDEEGAALVDRRTRDFFAQHLG